MGYQEENQKTIDRWVKEGWEWGKPISHEEFLSAKNGELKVKLTPTKYVPREWFGDLKGKRILGLASGGGQQIPVFSAHGAICSVLDYSNEQCESERLVAKREGYTVEVLNADMTKPLPFSSGQFDIVFHPVSNNYVEKVEPIFCECYRVLKNGGILICGLDTGINYIFDDEEKILTNKLPFNPLKNKEYMRQLREDNAGVQFSHTLEEQIGGQLKAGFILTDLYEDTNGEGRLHEFNVPSFIGTRSIKKI